MGAGASTVGGTHEAADGGGAAARATPQKSNSSKNSSPSSSPAKPGVAQTKRYTVSLIGWHKNRIVLPDKFLLRISLESLDFVNCESQTPLVQFPFQNILCWGSNDKMFQFSVFDVDNCLVGKAPDTIPIYLRTSEGKDIEKYLMETVRRLMSDMDQVHTVTKDEFKRLKNLLFGLDASGNIVGVGMPSSPGEDDRAGTDAPSQSSAISSEDSTPSTQNLTGPATDIQPPELREDWLQVIDQFSLDRKFLAKQGMELMLLIGPLHPFEKFDLALLLHDRILNSESFQLIVNTFEDAAERGNLILRLGLDKKTSVKQGEFATNCKIMQEFVPTPGSPIKSVKKTNNLGNKDDPKDAKESPQEDSPRPNYGS